MENIDSEINKLKEVIRRHKFRISKLDGTNEKNQKMIIALNEHILYLEQQVKDLEDKKSYQQDYHSRKPEYGDRRYKSFSCKNAIDMLRVLYYNYFGKDPNISFVENDYVMFGDPTLPISVFTYLIRGEVPFKIMFERDYDNYEAIDSCAVAINFERKIMNKENFEKYLYFMMHILKIYSNNDVNLICSDGKNKSCTLAYIGYRNFHYYDYSDFSKGKMYYEFFELLCDNLMRNIIYIGDTMKTNASSVEIEKVNSEFVNFHMKLVANVLGVTTEELAKENEDIKRYVLKHCRSL